MGQTETAKNDDTFLLEIVSPERVLSSEPVRFAVLPALEGGIGVLPGHAPLLTALKPGIIEIHGAAANDDVRKVFVSSGFLEINEKQCIALTVDAIAVEDISKDESELPNEVIIATAAPPLKKKSHLTASLPNSIVADQLWLNCCMVFSYISSSSREIVMFFFYLHLIS